MLPARVKTDAVVASTGMGCKRKRLEGLIVEKRLLLLLPLLLPLLLLEVAQAALQPRPPPKRPSFLSPPRRLRSDVPTCERRSAAAAPLVDSLVGAGKAPTAGWRGSTNIVQGGSAIDDSDNDAGKGDRGWSGGGTSGSGGDGADVGKADSGSSGSGPTEKACRVLSAAFVSEAGFGSCRGRSGGAAAFKVKDAGDEREEEEGVGIGGSGSGPLANDPLFVGPGGKASAAAACRTFAASTPSSPATTTARVEPRKWRWTCARLLSTWEAAEGPNHSPGSLSWHARPTFTMLCTEYANWAPGWSATARTTRR